MSDASHDLARAVAVEMLNDPVVQLQAGQVQGGQSRAVVVQQGIPFRQALGFLLTGGAIAIVASVATSWWSCGGRGRGRRSRRRRR